MSYLSARYLPRSSLAGQSTSWQSMVLGGAAFSPAVGDVEFPCAVVNTPQLPVGGELCEVWYTNEPVREGRSGTIRYRYSEQLLFGCVELPESSFAESSSAAGDATPLQRASEQAFREIFELLDAANFPYLLRVWNYFPDINSESHGLERYRQFNSGRQDGFRIRSRALVGNVPAACALGSDNGPLTIYFLAGREEPVAIENPRQISAYHYPQEYGPRSPTFSRASLCRIGGQEVLFISGTASIIGHRSEHIGDVVAQTRETFANIAAVVDEANRAARQARFTLQELCYKVYVRHPSDFDAIRREVVAVVGEQASVIYLRADVCREDLLVEIEATAGHPLEML